VFFLLHRHFFVGFIGHVDVALVPLFNKHFLVALMTTQFKHLQINPAVVDHLNDSTRQHDLVVFVKRFQWEYKSYFLSESDTDPFTCDPDVVLLCGVAQCTD
jgi:hypothetical protein